ncbi:hypothetical protein TELCIR_17861, partial [Teladorsagia circumcincta]
YADFEFRLPKSFHGTDNGAIHAYLAEFIVPTAGVDLAICLWIYNNSKGYDDLFAYEACIRDLLGNGPSFGKIKILPKSNRVPNMCIRQSHPFRPDPHIFLHHHCQRPAKISEI